MVASGSDACLHGNIDAYSASDILLDGVAKKPLKKYMNF
jgi:hypothetical protein